MTLVIGSEICSAPYENKQVMFVGLRWDSINFAYDRHTPYTVKKDTGKNYRLYKGDYCQDMDGHYGIWKVLDDTPSLTIEDILG